MVRPPRFPCLKPYLAALLLVSCFVLFPSQSPAQRPARAQIPARAQRLARLPAISAAQPPEAAFPLRRNAAGLLVPDSSALGSQLRTLGGDLPDTAVKGGHLPPDASIGLFDPVQMDGEQLRRRSWESSELFWEPSELEHFPLYFADTPLERYGQSRPGLIQPAISAGRFFASMPVLPYKLQLEPPRRPVSSLGTFRAGSPTPRMAQRLPFDRRAALVEAAAWAALIVLFP